MAQTPWALPDGFEESVSKAIKKILASLKNSRKAIPEAALEALKLGDWTLFQQLMDWHGVESAFEPFKELLAITAKASALDFYKKGGVAADLVFNLIDERAVTWASYQAGDLVTNITEEMRLNIRNTITSSTMGDMTWQQAAAEIEAVIPLSAKDAETVRRNYERMKQRFEKKGMTAKQAEAKASFIRDAYAEKLLNARAKTIARTEIARAATQGRVLGWQAGMESGLVDNASVKEWVAEPDACPICHELDGKTVPWNKSFENGVSETPAHPNCRCAIVLLPPDYADSVFTNQAMQKSAIFKADDSFKPTQGMKWAAERALRWKKEGKATGAGTPVGWGRASDIVAGRSMSLDVVKRMYSFFSRHEVDKKGKDFNNLSNPSNGRIMWDAWGGDAGYSWSKKIVERAKKQEKLAKHMAGKHDQSTHAHRMNEFAKPPFAGLTGKVSASKPYVGLSDKSKEVASRISQNTYVDDYFESNNGLHVIEYSATYKTDQGEEFRLHLKKTDRDDATENFPSTFVYVAHAFDAKDNEVGWLTVYNQMISGIDVLPRHKRKGIGTALLEFTRRESERPIFHDSVLSEDGKGFAEITKHLAGKHDQSTHGHGKAGGEGRVIESEKEKIASIRTVDRTIPKIEQFDDNGIPSTRTTAEATYVSEDDYVFHLRYELITPNVPASEWGIDNDVSEVGRVSYREDLDSEWSDVRFYNGEFDTPHEGAGLVFMRWNKSENPYIVEAGVEKKYQRKGLATAMLAFARDNYPLPIEHSELRSKEGWAWSEVVKHLAGQHDQSTHGRSISQELFEFDPLQPIPDSPKNAAGMPWKAWDLWEHGPDGNQFISIYRKYAGEALGIPMPPSPFEEGGWQHMFTQRGFGGVSLDTARKHAEGMVKAINNSKPQPTLYRGLDATSNPDQADQLQAFLNAEVGSEFDMVLASTSRSLGVAAWYAADRSRGINPVVMRIREGAKGVASPADAWYTQDHEVITNGRFRILGKEEVSMPYWKRSTLGLSQGMNQVSSFGDGMRIVPQEMNEGLFRGIKSGNVSAFHTDSMKFVLDRPSSSEGEALASVWTKQDDRKFTFIDVEMVDTLKPIDVQKAYLGNPFDALFADRNFINDSESDVERKARLSRIAKRFFFAKHLLGMHDQSTHAGKHSIKNLQDLVSNASKLQEAMQTLASQEGTLIAKGNIPMRVLLEHLGKGGKPELVASIDQLDGKPMYRGTSTEQADEEINAEFARVGTGVSGDGYYFSNREQTAEYYALDAKNWSPSNSSEIIVAGWKKDAKVMSFVDDSHRDAYRGHYDAAVKAADDAFAELKIVNGASESEQGIFDNFYNSTAQALVTKLMLDGYDGLEIAQPNGLGEKHTIVFNREALQVVDK